MNAALCVSRIDAVQPSRDQLADDVRVGLTRCPKRLPSKYFYDSRGSHLFEQICALPEYYLTRTELSIMREHAGAIAAALGRNVLLLEYGSGSGIKTRLLLEHLERPAAYVPVELARDALAASVADLHNAMPQLEVLPVCADFTTPLAPVQPRRQPHRTVVYFPGSTIGNFGGADAVALLRKMRVEMGPLGGAVIGVDLKKDPAILEAAYNDTAGITAQFTLNLLQRLNRELGADFDLAAFRHRAFYNESAGRIETYLISARAQDVHVAGITTHFAANEAMLVELSCKYGIDDFARLAASAGLRAAQVWTDSQRLFSIQYLIRDCDAM
jgi:dimethylhistidine N-methyltransferase